MTWVINLITIKWLRPFVHAHVRVCTCTRVHTHANILDGHMPRNINKKTLFQSQNVC